MLRRAELQGLALARLKDAEVLYDAARFDAAAYMCGYALEMALKARVCRCLGVDDYPEDKLKKAFKTHDLDDLLLLGGLSQALSVATSPEVYANWSKAIKWRPEWRYRPIGSVDDADALTMLDALRIAPHGVLTWLQTHW